MSEFRPAEVAELVKSALEREPAEWPAFLDEACGVDMKLRAEVESLLGFKASAQSLIEQPAVQIAAEMLAEDLPVFSGGERVGRYEVIALIGSGGMGEVYLAQDIQLRRKVALKFIKNVFGSQNLLRHFRAEERILAALNHPNIAQLYGAETTADGTPYFVMEYVEGERLDRFSDDRELVLDARLRLFTKVCAAVSYAHQHLVIHRDLKPANIRVTPDGEPKLLDFGIAKLFDPETLDAPERTVTLAGTMTPEYASPEQVRGERMTTASDVYSLGVVLYELLTGEKPYSLTSRQPHEIARAITDQEAARPSTKALSDNPKSKIQNPKFLRGDLDNIVLMAMRKEPQRRYSSVAQFSEDISRHLDGLPVTARKDTWAYRSAKFVRRNKLAVAAAALLLLSLIGGILATTLEGKRAQQQRARAERRFDEVRRLANSLMFEIHDSVQNLQGSTPTRQLIVTRALQYLDSLAQEAGDNPALQRELATAYEKIGDIQGNPYSANLGDTDGALASYRKALSIRKRFAGEKASTETEMELGRSFRGLGDIFEQKGDIGQSIENYRHSLAIFEQLGTSHPDDSAVQDELARAYETLGEGLARTDHKEERAAAYRKTLEIRRRLLARNPTDAKLRRSTGLAFLKVGSASAADRQSALENLHQGTELLEKLSTEDSNNARARREVGMAYYFTGTALTDAGDYGPALEARRKALDIRQEIAAQDPRNKQARFDLAVGHGDLCEAYTRTAKPAEALAEGEQSLAILSELTTSDPTNAVYQRNLGLCYERLGDAQAIAGAIEGSSSAARREAWREARAWYQKAFDLFGKLQQGGILMPADAPQIAKFKERMAACEQASSALPP